MRPQFPVVPNGERYCYWLPISFYRNRSLYQPLRLPFSEKGTTYRSRILTSKKNIDHEFTAAGLQQWAYPPACTALTNQVRFRRTEGHVGSARPRRPHGLHSGSMRLLVGAVPPCGLSRGGRIRIPNPLSLPPPTHRWQAPCPFLLGERGGPLGPDFSGRGGKRQTL